MFLKEMGFTSSSLLASARHSVLQRERPGAGIYSNERAKTRTLSAELNDAYLRRQEGKKGEAVVQGRKGGSLYGVTGNYVDVKIVNAPLFAKRGMLLEGVFGSRSDRFMEFIGTDH